MLSEAYQEAFHDVIKDLEPVAIGLICAKHGINVDHFLKWISVDKVRMAKVQEITEARVIEFEKKRKQNA